MRIVRYIIVEAEAGIPLPFSHPTTTGGMTQ
jgi:hypothetical protein